MNCTFTCSCFLLLLLIIESSLGFTYVSTINIRPAWLQRQRTRPMEHVGSACHERCLTSIRLSIFSFSLKSHGIQLESQHLPDETAQPTDNKYPHGMTSTLYELAEQLRDVPMDSLRYQQLFHFANLLKPMDNKLKVPTNKVLGCQSTVYVHCTAKDQQNNTTIDGRANEPLLYYTADSDSMLTKGLVSMLTIGLSGHSVDDILAVDPEFIRYAGIEQSLTPGRNSGLLNMLSTMKRQAKAVVDALKPHGNKE